MGLLSYIREKPMQAVKNTAKIGTALAVLTFGGLVVANMAKNERIQEDAAETQAFDDLLALAKKTGATRENPGISFEKDGSMLLVIVQENGAVRVYRHRGDQLDIMTPAYQKILHNAVAPAGETQEK